MERNILNMLAEENVVSISFSSPVIRKMSTLYEVNVELLSGQCRSYFLKKYNQLTDSVDAVRRRVIAEYLSSVQMSDLITSSYPNSTIKFVSIYEEHLALLSEKINGIELNIINKESSKRYTNTMSISDACELNYNVGHWLKSFQTTSLCDTSSFDVNQYYSDLKNTISLLEELGALAFIKVNNLSLESVVSMLAAEVFIEEDSVNYILGDFAHYNVFSSEGKIVVYDFDLEKTGFAYFDVAHYCNSLREQLYPKFQISSFKVDMLIKSFLDGYGVFNIENNSIFKICSLKIILLRIRWMYIRKLNSSGLKKIKCMYDLYIYRGFLMNILREY